MRDRAPRWILVGTILGSGAVFVEGSVTMVALPAMARDFHLGIAGLQWVLNGYLLTLSALMLLGGALGDHFSRRRVFAIGLAGFSVASIACALAPNLLLLVVARVLQGAAGWLVDATSWRWVFVCIAPLAAAAVVAVGARGGPDARESGAATRDVDYAGAALVTLGLAGIVGALMVGPDAGFTQP